jgi:two-component system sensor histidine kinase CiaH
MFQKARIKLTAWYLLIIMVISASFSVAMYKALLSELDRVERMHRLRIENRLPQRPEIPSDLRDNLPQSFLLDPALLAQTKTHLVVILTLINIAILGVSAAAGYFLAGKNLKPIKEMVDEQNRFIADASHELRTPLTSLKTEMEVTLRDKKLTVPNAKKLITSNLEEVNKLQSLSDNLIMLTQYQKGGNNLTIENLQLTHLVTESVKKVTTLAKTKGIKIKNNVKNYKFEGNRQTLSQVIVIFLDNAIKYNPKETEVTLSSGKTDSQIIIKVSDNGIGINKENIPHLFDRFYRVDKSRTKTDVKGYGLGLSIAKQIIDKHNGSIKIESKIGKGTTFTVQLPLKHSARII